MKTDLNLTDFWLKEIVTFKYLPDTPRAKRNRQIVARLLIFCVAQT